MGLGHKNRVFQATDIVETVVWITGWKSKNRICRLNSECQKVTSNQLSTVCLVEEFITSSKEVKFFIGVCLLVKRIMQKLHILNHFFNKIGWKGGTLTIEETVRFGW